MDEIDRHLISLNHIPIFYESKNTFSETIWNFWTLDTQYMCVSNEKISDWLSKTCFFWVFSFISNDIDPWLSKIGCASKRAKTIFSAIRNLYTIWKMIHHWHYFLCVFCVHLCGNYNIIITSRLYLFLDVFHQMLRFGSHNIFVWFLCGGGCIQHKIGSLIIRWFVYIRHLNFVSVIHLFSNVAFAGAPFSYQNH